MKNTISERVKEILTTKGMKPKIFAESSGFNYKSLNAIFNGRMAENLNLILAIKSTFPDISMEWLLSGEGNMLKSKNYNLENAQSTANESIKSYTSANSIELIELMNKKIIAPYSAIEEKDKTIDLKSQEIGNLREEIGRLKGILSKQN